MRSVHVTVICPLVAYWQSIIQKWINKSTIPYIYYSNIIWSEWSELTRKVKILTKSLRYVINRLLLSVIGKR